MRSFLSLSVVVTLSMSVVYWAFMWFDMSTMSEMDIPEIIGSLYTWISVTFFQRTSTITYAIAVIVGLSGIERSSFPHVGFAASTLIILFPLPCVIAFCEAYLRFKDEGSAIHKQVVWLTSLAVAVVAMLLIAIGIATKKSLWPDGIGVFQFVLLGFGLGLMVVVAAVLFTVVPFAVEWCFRSAFQAKK